MLSLQCEKCAAKFQFDETKLPPKGAKGRCGKCGHVFSIVAPSKESPTPAPESPSISDLMTSVLEQVARPSELEDSPEVKNEPLAQGFQVPQDMMQKYQSKMNQSFKNAGPSAMSIDSGATKAAVVSKRTAHKHALVLAGLATLFFLSSAILKTGALTPESFWLAWKGSRIESQERAFFDQKADVRVSASLEKTIHVEARLYNASDAPMNRAKIKLEVLGPDGAPLGSTETLCCEKPIPSKESERVETTVVLPLEAPAEAYRLSILGP